MTQRGLVSLKLAGYGVALFAAATWGMSTYDNPVYVLALAAFSGLMLLALSTLLRST